MCVDYRDLNRASPKDNFSLPHIDTLVDNTAGHSYFSVMDGFSGYNQIKMCPDDMSKTTFMTLWGMFCYKVMPFGLKNAGATYQRAMVALFHDMMMHKEIEVYVDDMIAKSRTENEYIKNQEKQFQRLREFHLKLNPTKCTFGVTSRKLLGFIVSKKGIEIDPNKVHSFQELPRTKTQKEVRDQDLAKVFKDSKEDQAQRMSKGIVPEVDISFSLGLRLRSQVHAMLVMTLSFTCYDGFIVMHVRLDLNAFH
ncbi:hypothetical protein GQ457_15G017580 [Hibiscus cannabinus]